MTSEPAVRERDGLEAAVRARGRRRQQQQPLHEIDKETRDEIDVIESRLIKYHGYNEASANDVLSFVASIFARGDVRE